MSIKVLTKTEKANIEANYDLIEIHAARHRMLGIDYEDAYEAAVEGLCEAAQTYDASKSTASFRTFASYRVKGAILDYCRKVDPVSRNHRDFLKAKERLCAELGKEQLTNEEVAAIMGIDEDKVKKYSKTVSQVPIDNLVDEWGCEPAAPEDIIETYEAENCSFINYSLETEGLLSDTEREVIKSHFVLGYKQNEIAAMLGVSAPRINQVMKKALNKLKAAYVDYCLMV